MERLLPALKDTPVVLLVGPRQSGKSTLAQSLPDFGIPIHYKSLDDPLALEEAKRDPRAFLNDPGSLFVIDEVQWAPELFLHIKHLVDRDRRPGRFLLTGSAHPLFIPRVADSLAGRMEIQTLFPFSIEEMCGRRQGLLQALFSNKPFQADRWASRHTSVLALRKAVAKQIIDGGYPEIQGRFDATRRAAWFESYLTSLLQRDLPQIIQIESVVALPKLLGLLATRSAQLLNFGDLSRSAQLPTTTLRRYCNLLSLCFFIHTLPAWSNNAGLRLIKSPKVFLYDTGLLSHLLGCDVDSLMETPDLWGSLFETFVVNEMKKRASWELPFASLYHYRTTSQKKVDLIIEKPGGQLIGVECKATATLSSRDFQGLRSLKEHAGDRMVRGVIFYLGAEVYEWGPHIALPIPFL